MKKFVINWKNDGWTTVQEADAKKHELEITIRAEDGRVVEARMRHNDGEEKAAAVTVDGKKILPVALDEFKKLYADGKLEIR